MFFVLLFIVTGGILRGQIVREPWNLLELPKLVASEGFVPEQIAVSQFEDLYLLDIENYSIIHVPSSFSKTGKGKQSGGVNVQSSGRLKRAGGWGNKGDLFSDPVDIVATPGLDVLVCDRSNHRILRFDRNLNYIGELMTLSLLPEGISYPYRMAVSSRGDLYISSLQDARMVMISADGRHIMRIGGERYGKNRFTEVVCIAMGDQDKVGIVDATSQLFYILTRIGDVIDEVKLPESENYFLHWWKNVWLILTSAGGFYYYDPHLRILSEVLLEKSLSPHLHGREPGKDVVNETNYPNNPMDYDIANDTIYVINQSPKVIYTAVLKFIK